MTTVARLDVCQLMKGNSPEKRQGKHTCNKIKKALQLNIKRNVKGDGSETQSQVGWLKEVIVCVSLKLSRAIGADGGRSDDLRRPIIAVLGWTV